MTRRVKPFRLQRPLRALHCGHSQCQSLFVIRRVLRRKIETGGVIAAF